MTEDDIRWVQRFGHYKKAMVKLDAAVSSLSKLSDDEEINKSLSELEKEGVIQRFEYTHELAWNVMKDYLEYQGFIGIIGSRDATREAFKNNLIDDGEKWMDMIKSRNQTAHTYNEETSKKIFLVIVRSYYPLFIAFQLKMEGYTTISLGDTFSNEL